MAEQEVGIGIVGSGYMGRTYAECVARYNRGARLVAIAGGTRAPGLASDYGVDAEPSVEALLSRSDVAAVIITSPQSAHAAQTVAAARHRKHVLVEKPMATSTAECRQMIDACRDAGVELSVIKPWRYRGATRGLRECIERGEIGEVRMISLWWLYPQVPFIGKDWFRDPKEGGFFLDAGSHCFDYLRWVAGAEPTHLYAQVATYNQDSETPRSTMTTLSFANGVMASLWLSYEVPPPGWENTDFRARVVGASGELDAHGYGALRVGRGQAWELVYEQAPIDYINRPMERTRLEAFFEMTQDFIDAVREGRRPPVTGADGLAAVAMVEAGYRSSELGQAVDFKVNRRFPACILATVVVPWTQVYTLDEGLFRDEISALLAAGYSHLYIFGTAGEGYAVDDAQFEHIARVFSQQMRDAGAEPMVGVISLSMETLLRRIAWARDTLGVRLFQISLPGWGALEDAEVRTFFDAVLGRFEDCQFLHYNLLRTKRLVTADEYAAIAADHPNLVATKNSTDSLLRVRELIDTAPMLQHFLNEHGFAFGSLVDDCGLLISLASTNLAMGHRYFAAGRTRDIETLLQLEGELARIGRTFAAVIGAGATRIDGAFDKVLWHLHDDRFPLRLLPPYQGSNATAAATFLAFLRQNYPHWAPPR